MRAYHDKNSASQTSMNVDVPILFHELARVTFESFLALDATEVVGFSVVCYLEFGGVFVKYRTANRVSWHFCVLYLMCQ